MHSFASDTGFKAARLMLAAWDNAMGSVVNFENESCISDVNNTQMTDVLSAGLQAYLVASTPAKITKAPPAYPVAPMVSSGMN